jgi:hypothetical protein
MGMGSPPCHQAPECDTLTDLGHRRQMPGGVQRGNPNAGAELTMSWFPIGSRWSIESLMD